MRYTGGRESFKRDLPGYGGWGVRELNGGVYTG